MTTWTAKVGLRKPRQVLTPEWFMRAVESAAEAMGSYRVEHHYARYAARQQEYYRNVGYDQGGVIGGPVMVSNDTDTMRGKVRLARKAGHMLRMHWACVRGAA